MSEVSDKDLLWLHSIVGEWQNDELRPIGLVELASALNVTPRTVQNWIKRLVDDGWIDWKSKRGRGYIPCLRRRKDPGAELALRCQKYLKAGQLARALKYLPEVYKAQVLKACFDSKEKDRFLADNVLYIPFYRPIHDLNPHTATRRTEAHLISHIHRGLVFFDVYENKVKAGIAHHWEPVGRKYIFFLRKNVRFHDGSLVNAQSVVDAFQALTDNKHPNSTFTECISSIKAVSEFILEIDLNRMNPLFIQMLTLDCFNVIKSNSQGTDIVGCGPFKLEEHNDQRTVLRAFDEYYGERPILDAVEFWTLDRDYEVIDLNAHMMSDYALSGREWPHQTLRHVEVGASMIIFNQRGNSLVRKLNIRQALCRSLNLDTLPGINNEKPIVAYGLIPNRKKQALKSSFNARALDLPKALHLVTYQLASNILLANWIVRSWSDIGIDCKLTVLDYPDFSEKNALSRYDVFVTGEVFDENLELSYYQFFKSNYLLEAGLLEEDLNDLHKKVDEFNPEISVMEQFQSLEDYMIERLNFYPLTHTERDLHISNDVSHLRINAYGWLDFTTAWLRGSV